MSGQPHLRSVGALDGVSVSRVFLQIFSPAMIDDPETNVASLLQLGAAIMLDKPIVLVVRPGDVARLPERLRRVADRVVELDADEEPSTEPIVAALRDLGLTGDAR